MSERSTWTAALRVVAVLMAFSALFQLLGQIQTFRTFEAFAYPWDGALWLLMDGLLSIAAVLAVQRWFDRHGAPAGHVRLLLISLALFVPLSVAEQVLVERFIFDKSHTAYTLLRYAAFQTTWHLIVANGFIAYRYLTALGRVREQLALTERDRAEMELRQLQRSVSPHFLFNSLNILHALIGRDTQRAAEFTARLARLYRYIVRTQDAEVVPLNDELEFVRDYRYLIEQRFGRAWTVDVAPSPSTASYLVVPTAVQTLIENAIKHNHARESQPLRVAVEIDEDVLTVRNERRGNPDTEGPGTGLSLLRARYARLDDRPVGIDDGEQWFCVTLPLIRSL